MNKALIVGSINVDKVYEVEHIVRPGETISSRGYRTAWGGKGLNQAVALCRAGAGTALAGCIGEAEYASLLALCAETGLDAAHVRVSDRPSGHAVIQVDGSGQNCIIVEPGANADIRPEALDAVFADFGAGDVLLTQNEIAHMPDVLRAGRERGMTVALNPSPFTEDILSFPLECVDVFLVNETEGEALSGESEPERMLDALRAKFPHAAIVLTLGGDGAVYADGKDRFSVPACRVKAVDTTAAGDTFTGYFLAGLLRGDTPRCAMETAAKAAAIAVTRPGAAPSIPRREEVAAACL